jgi:hypothetical protein
MVDQDDGPGGGGKELVPRDPTVEDLVELCRHLNEAGAKYAVVGGFAVRASGYNRHTMDVDLIIDASLGNEAKVFAALESLPDQAVKELDPGDVAKYTVVRVADEILVDLMQSASGIDYETAVAEDGIIIREIEGVGIPFASPRLLWKMKVNTHREKDAADLVFLREYFAARGESPPE